MTSREITKTYTERAGHEIDELPIVPTNPDYATQPIEQAFDWNEIIQLAKARRELGAKALYLVVFRSTLKENADSSVLLDHDRRAHDAALESPALIHYFGGTPNAERQALSFCLWESEEEAKAISRDQRHVDATKMVSLYDHYSIERYDVHIDGEEVLLVARTAEARPHSANTA